MGIGPHVEKSLISAPREQYKVLLTGFWRLTISMESECLNQNNMQSKLQ